MVMLILLPILVVLLMWAFWHLFQSSRHHAEANLGGSPGIGKYNWQQLYLDNRHWLVQNMDTCPADLLTPDGLHNLYTEGQCDTAMFDCLTACRQGDAARCFNLGIEVQKLEDPGQDAFSESLFQHACAGGSVLACTNRAAGISMIDADESNGCAVRTYQKTCRQDEVWGCTMLGHHLARGRGIEKDFTQAKQFLHKACDIDPDTEACDNAKDILVQIAAIEAESSPTE